MKILIACEESQIVTEQFLLKGHDVMSCDIEYDGAKGLPHYKGNVLDIIDNGWDMMIGFPPCTYLTVTGNKWFKSEFKDRFPDRIKQREKAIEFFFKLINAQIEKICIENPIGVMSTEYDKPDQIIHPYYFGDSERKPICLWLKKLPKLIYCKEDNLFEKKTTVEPELYIYRDGRKDPMWHVKTMGLPKNERSKARSKTFPGIAKAMAEQWG